MSERREVTGTPSADDVGRRDAFGVAFAVASAGAMSAVLSIDPIDQPATTIVLLVAISLAALSWSCLRRGARLTRLIAPLSLVGVLVGAVLVGRIITDLNALG